MAELASIIGAEPFLRKLQPGQIEKLASFARRVSFPAGARLFEEGGNAHDFWLIVAGRVALDALIPGQGRVTIETLGRGDVVSLSWLTAPYQYRYGALSLQPVQAFEFDAKAVRAACDSDPALGYALLDRFLAVAALRLQATRARLLESRPVATP
ncbi:MAG TPA: cyclic nucleotide-binding domain-containing protein [Streptosporangiaceae bacterium]|jgi:CRP/FNR family cyclic AMP-dependent transcriptional regulator|nr:cyclic nucleotide-binding domain-containing protein [Streptosporangiaceae bacterium]